MVDGQIEKRDSMTLFRGALKPCVSLPNIFGHAEAFVVTKADKVHAVDMTSLRCLQEQRKRFAVILARATAIKQVLAFLSCWIVLLLWHTGTTVAAGAATGATPARAGYDGTVALRIFIHVAAAFTAFVPFGTAAFLAVFFPGGKRGCAWTMAVFFSLVGIGTAFLVPDIVGWGTAAGAIIGASVGAATARLSTPKDKR